MKLCVCTYVMLINEKYATINNRKNNTNVMSIQKNPCTHNKQDQTQKPKSTQKKKPPHTPQMQGRGSPYKCFGTSTRVDYYYTFLKVLIIITLVFYSTLVDYKKAADLIIYTF